MLSREQWSAVATADDAEFGVDPRAGQLLSERRLPDVAHPQSTFSEHRVAELHQQLTAAGHPHAAASVPPRGEHSAARPRQLQRRLLPARAVAPLDGRVPLVELVAYQRHVVGARKLHLEPARLQPLHRVQVYTHRRRKFSNDSITNIPYASRSGITRISIQTAVLAFGGTGLCSCRVTGVGGSCPKHLTVESYKAIYAANSHTYYY